MVGADGMALVVCGRWYEGAVLRVWVESVLLMAWRWQHGADCVVLVMAYWWRARC